MPNTIPLDVIDVARPCPADWNAMHGNGQVRFCDHCQLNVYNLSAMTREAAERLILEKEGHLCARFYRRADGTVITADCGGGWKLRAKKLGRVLAGACAAILGGMLAPHSWAESPKEIKGDVAVPSVQGEVCLPTVATTQPSTQPTTRPVGEIVAPPITGLIALPPEKLPPPATQPTRRAKLPRPTVSNNPTPVEVTDK